MADKEQQKIHATFTPVRRPLTFDYEKDCTNQSLLVTAIQQRLKAAGKTSLTKYADEQFLMGIISVFPLRYAADILLLVRESDEVEVSVA